MSNKFIVVAVALAAAACSKDTVKPPVAANVAKPVAHTTVAKADPAPVDHTPQAVTNMLGLDSEILRVCNVHVDAPQPDAKEEAAPHFDFDESALSAQDTAILAQVAKCLTSGPLAGRHLQLVGRADARGTSEYNFVLGASRASTVSKYLEQQGVDSPRINETSRGELDAKGTDEQSMREDRRVDIMLGS